MRMIEKFKNLLTQHPDLRPYLIKICRRYRKKGVLAGMMKLGQGLATRELEGLHSMFGMQAMTISKTDEVHVSFDRFFAHMSPVMVTKWITDLHSCLDLPLSSIDHEKRLHRQETELFLERLRIAFPELKGVHQALEKKSDSVNRLIASGRDIQNSYFRAAEITRFLRKNREVITFSELGARFCTNSKALRNTALSKLIESWLVIMENSDAACPVGKGQKTVWDRHHVVSDRLSVQATLFGPLIYEKNNLKYDWIYNLWRAGEPATLSLSNIAGIDHMYAADDAEVSGRLITCENEAPFGRMVRERQPGIVLYTSGFPNDAVLSLYRLMAPVADRCLHWGDSDLAGLQIAAMLHAVHPLKLWRCDLANLQAHRDCLIPAPEEQKKRITRFLANQPQFPFAAELKFTLKHGWLEQESRLGKG
jgi:hypothetical protein